MKCKAILIGIVFSVMCVTNAMGASSLKKTVAVFDFQNDSGYSSVLNLGQDFSTQLSDALIQSGKFIVLTRQDIDVVIAEQDLAQSGRFAKSSTAKVGKILPAQILIKGRITEFQENKSGGGQGFSIHGVTLGANKATAHIAVIVQLVDSTTGEIIDSKRVEGQANAGGFSIGYSGSFSLSSSSFKKTPLGKAVQMAIDRAAIYVSDKVSGMPWKGKVMLVKEGTIYVNSGNNVGISSGDTFSVYREGEPLVDPDTGMELGREREFIGQIKITEVEDKFSKARNVGASAVAIAKGDLITQ